MCVIGDRRPTSITISQKLIFCCSLRMISFFWSRLFFDILKGKIFGKKSIIESLSQVSVIKFEVYAEKKSFVFTWKIHHKFFLCHIIVNVYMCARAHCSCVHKFGILYLVCFCHFAMTMAAVAQDFF